MNDTIDGPKLKYYMSERVWCKAESPQLHMKFCEYIW